MYLMCSWLAQSVERAALDLGVTGHRDCLKKLKKIKCVSNKN